MKNLRKDFKMRCEFCNRQVNTWTEICFIDNKAQALHLCGDCNQALKVANKVQEVKYKMGLGEDVARDSCFNQIMGEAESYKDENDLWNSSADFGRFVIELLQQYDDLKFQGGEI